MPPFLKANSIRKILPRRPKDSHKGTNGHVLVIAGSCGMSGAAMLTALGAARVGAGLVTVATPSSLQPLVAGYIPEALTLGLLETAEGAIAERAYDALNHYIQKRTVTAVALGPGLSVAPDAAKVIKTILKEWELPLVLDADGLNNIAVTDIGEYPAIVITPHPVELSRLLQVHRDVIKKDRVTVAENTARDHHLICVLKGYHTVVTDGQATHLNPTGNPAMSTGGMGDVLTGMIAGLLAQRCGVLDAANAGVYLHGLAADLARISDRGLLASEVANAIPRALQKIEVR